MRREESLSCCTPREFYDGRHARGWKDYRAEDKLDRVIAKVEEALPSGTCTVLEYGCGTGNFTKAASGLPAVCTVVGDIAEILGPTSAPVLVASGDASAYAAAFGLLPRRATFAPPLVRPTGTGPWPITR